MERCYRCCVFLLCILLVAVPEACVAWAQPGASIDVDAIDAYFQQELATRRLPGMAVTIVEGDRVVLERGYGSAGGGRPVTPETQFYIGSLTKSFTALAVMQLVERGRLDLDAPVQHYLPWFRVADDAASAQITVRHLLNQTSGLSEKGDPQWNAQFPALAAQARALARAHLTAPIGSTFQYYNQNYRLLGLLIEQVSGKSYGQYLHDQVLAPLAMLHTVAEPSEATNLAQGYGQALGLPIARSQAFHAGSLPSGYLISSAGDLAHYLIALLNSGQYANQQVVQPTTLTQMFTPPAGVRNDELTPPAAVQRLLAPANGLEGGYGMGWIVGYSTDGARLLYHGGELENFHAEMLLLPQHRRGFVILVNQGSLFRQVLDRDPLWIGLAALLLGQSPPVHLSVEWVFPVFALVVVASLGIQLVRLVRLPHWGRKGTHRRRRGSWLWALAEVAIPMAVLIGPPLLGPVLGMNASWSDLFGMAPDVAAWLLLGAALTLLLGLGKLAILARQEP
jgi:CubicO group peptidase (beta-lactamase class C family)